MAVQRVRPAGIAVTMSIGVSAARGGAVDYETLFKTADEALYEAKRAGRNQVVAGADREADEMPQTSAPALQLAPASARAMA